MTSSAVASPQMSKDIRRLQAELQAVQSSAHGPFGHHSPPSNTSAVRTLHSPNYRLDLSSERLQPSKGFGYNTKNSDPMNIGRRPLLVLLSARLRIRSRSRRVDMRCHHRLAVCRPCPPERLQGLSMPVFKSSTSQRRLIGTERLYKTV